MTTPPTPPRPEPVATADLITRCWFCGRFKDPDPSPYCKCCWDDTDAEDAACIQAGWA